MDPSREGTACDALQLVVDVPEAEGLIRQAYQDKEPNGDEDSWRLTRCHTRHCLRSPLGYLAAHYVSVTRTDLPVSHLRLITPVGSRAARCRCKDRRRQSPFTLPPLVSVSFWDPLQLLLVGGDFATIEAVDESEGDSDGRQSWIPPRKWSRSLSSSAACKK